MKRTILISLIAVGIIYATEQSSTVEYEHALKSTASVEAAVEDMSKMKAMGKCGADQKAGKSTIATKETNGSTVSVDYEHALKSSSSQEGVSEDMSKMKAMGKCGGDK
jgi:methylthioribose-1-phosphate isomerase